MLRQFDTKLDEGKNEVSATSRQIGCSKFVLTDALSKRPRIICIPLYIINDDIYILVAEIVEHTEIYL
ncbi:25164_t:CDS:2 [Cetraspora pellucida]|uniref:25164_t:CDS:1 n=1 Tax=Cetraspora pellucida TaxID=1433469 RepID=A0A9N9A020_9GLOM|nr:25164_t:CDS:2 [Cetraspora pellucida]